MRLSSRSPAVMSAEERAQEREEEKKRLRKYKKFAERFRRDAPQREKEELERQAHEDARAAQVDLGKIRREAEERVARALDEARQDKITEIEAWYSEAKEDDLADEREQFRLFLRYTAMMSFIEHKTKQSSIGGRGWSPEAVRSYNVKRIGEAPTFAINSEEWLTYFYSKHAPELETNTDIIEETVRQYETNLSYMAQKVYQKHVDSNFLVLQSDTLPEFQWF